MFISRSERSKLECSAIVVFVNCIFEVAKFGRSSGRYRIEKQFKLYLKLSKVWHSYHRSFYGSRPIIRGGKKGGQDGAERNRMKHVRQPTQLLEVQ